MSYAVIVKEESGSEFILWDGLDRIEAEKMAQQRDADDFSHDRASKSADKLLAESTFGTLLSQRSKEDGEIPR